MEGINMSDCFDHMFDAYSSRFDEDYEDDGFGYNIGTSKNPDYYHTKIKFKSIVFQTEKAYLLDIGKEKFEVWIPKKVCRHLSELDKTIFIHTETLSKIVTTKLANIKELDYARVD
jgi:hypothetical protein